MPQTPGLLTFTVLLAAFLSAPLWAEEVNREAARPNAQAFDREVRECAELLRLPGLSLAIVQDGAIVHRLRLGFSELESRKPIGDDSIFWLASVTKTFAAVMMMQYEREGRLSLDRAAGHFHPRILHSIAKRFEARGDRENSLKYYRLLVDSNGFEEAGEKIEAYCILAREYTKQGDFEKARDDFWRALIYTRQRGGDGADILQEIKQIANRKQNRRTDNL